MPLSFDSSGPVARVTASGKVSHAQIIELFAEMRRRAPVAGHVPVFVDTRGVTKAPSTAELRLIGRDMQQLTDAGFGPFAVLTGSTWMYGVVRMFAVFAQATTQVVALRSVEDMERWIDDRAIAPGPRGGA